MKFLPFLAFTALLAVVNQASAQSASPPTPPNQLESCMSQFSIIRGYLGADEQALIAKDQQINKLQAEIESLKKAAEEKKPEHEKK